MLQSVVTLLLIPCLLLNQSAAFAHSHGEYTGEGHGARAHIHIAGKSSTADHDDKHDHHGHSHNRHSHQGHSHHGHSHGHSHSDGHQGESKAPTKERKSESCSTPFQHDANCVYVADVVAVGLDRTTVKVFEINSLPCFVLTQWNSPDLQLRTHKKWSDWPPPLLLGDCPLYLRHLSLLI